MFEVLARECHRLKGRVTVEWLRLSNHWRNPEVKRLNKGLGLDAIEFDGCAFPTKGSRNRFIKFPMTLMSNMNKLRDHFQSKRCPKGTSHKKHVAEYAKQLLASHVILYRIVTPYIQPSRRS